MSARDLFWLAAGLLTALAAGFVLGPLLPPAQQLRQRVRNARGPLLGTLLVSLLALGWYLWRGSPNQPGMSLPPSHPQLNAAAGTRAAQSAAPQAGGSMEVALAQLEQRLGMQGGSDQDWELLAQTYEFLGRKTQAADARSRHQVASDARAAAVNSDSAMTPQAQELMRQADSARKAGDSRAAAQAYQQLAALGAMTAQSWAEYADAAAALNGGKLQGAPEHYIDAALALDSGNGMALWEKASAQHATGRYAQAIETWQRLLSLTPADSPDRKIFAADLAEDQALVGAAPTAAASGTVVAQNRNTGVAEAAQVSGEVALADTLRDKVPAGSTLFIVAKSIDSPGPPVAVVRTQTGQWPLKFVLDDSLAMLPTRTLSKVGRVTVEARISLSGAAAAHSGDLQSPAAAIDPREHKAVRLVIDHVIG